MAYLKTSSFKQKADLSGNEYLIGIDGKNIKLLIKDLQYFLGIAGSVSFRGTASPGTNPGAQTSNGFWLAVEAGTYTNFGGVVLPASSFGVISYSTLTGWSIKSSTIPQPQNKINAWADGAFASGSQVIKDGQLWQANAAIVSGEVPGVSVKWINVLDFYTKAFLLEKALIYAVSSANLFDKSLAKQGTERYSPALPGVTIGGATAYATTNYIPVLPNTTYAISGTAMSGSGTPNGGAFNSGKAHISALVFTAVTGGYRFTTPALCTFVYINITDNSTFSAINTAQVELGSLPTAYVPFSADTYVNKSRIFPAVATEAALAISNAAIAANTAELSAAIVMMPSKNLIKVANTTEGKRYSPTSGIWNVTGATYMQVIVTGISENGTYALSGVTDPITGGAFSGDPNGSWAHIGALAFTTITSGKKMTAPSGANFFVINLTQSSKFSEKFTAQLEAGGVVTAYVSGDVGQKKLNPTYLPEGSGSTVTVGIGAPTFSERYKKFANFHTKTKNRSADVVVVLRGDSLVAREEYTVDFTAEQQKFRPPGCTSQNFFSALVDKLMWENQVYKRFDSGYFTESGVFTNTAIDATWDDSTRREGYTRFSTTPTASVSFEIPVDAWAVKFIYRTEQAGTTQARITVAEGTGKVEVYNGSAWVEANGYIFSQLEPAATTTKGNTTFGKRLNMRCKSGSIDSRATVKNVTINNQAGSGRLLYWGISHSEREFMIIFQNAARGSHNYSGPTVATKLGSYADNECWGFNPDLLVEVVPLVNERCSSPASLISGGYTRQAIWDIVNTWVFDAGFAQSVAAKTAGFTTCDVMLTTDTYSTLSAAIDPSTKKWAWFVEPTTGQKVISPDYFNFTLNQLAKKDLPGFLFANIYSPFVREIMQEFGNPLDGMTNSGISGNSYSNDGTHINTKGVLVWIKHLLPALDF